MGGIAHTIWLKSPRFEKFSYPIDGGRLLFGKLIFGPNKTFGAFIVLPVAVACAFFLLACLDRLWSWEVFSSVGWPTDTGALFGIGLLSAIGYLLAELPNSFLKRQFGVACGEEPKSRWRFVTITFDQCDSIIGALIVFSLLAPTSLLIWFFTLSMATGVHLLFNAILVKIGLKERAR